MGNETSQPVDEEQEHQYFSQRSAANFDNDSILNEVRQAAAPTALPKQAASLPNSPQPASRVEITSLPQATSAIPLTEKANGSIANDSAQLKFEEDITQTKTEVKTTTTRPSSTAVNAETPAANTVSLRATEIATAPTASAESPAVYANLPVEATKAPAVSAVLPTETDKSPTSGETSALSAEFNAALCESPEASAQSTAESPQQVVVSAIPPAVAGPSSGSPQAASKNADSPTASIESTSLAVFAESSAADTGPSELPLLEAKNHVYQTPEAPDNPPAVSEPIAVVKSPSATAKFPSEAAQSEVSTFPLASSAKLPLAASASESLSAAAATPESLSASSLNSMQYTLEELHKLNTDATKLQPPSNAKIPTNVQVKPKSGKSKTIAKIRQPKVTKEIDSTSSTTTSASSESLVSDQEPHSLPVEATKTKEGAKIESSVATTGNEVKQATKIKVTIDEQSKAMPASSTQKPLQNTAQDLQKLDSLANKLLPPKDAKTPNKNQVKPATNTSKTIVNEPQTHKGAIPKVPKQIDSTSSTTSSTPNDSQPSEPFLYLNPITLEAEYFLKTIADNVENFSVLDPRLVEALETIMLTIDAILQRNQDRFIVETEQVKFVEPAEMRLLKRSFICSLCKEYVGNTTEKATAHLANRHAMEGKRKSKKQRKREREREAEKQQKEQENQKKKSNPEQKQAAAKEKENHSISSSSTSLSKTANDDEAAGASKAARAKQNLKNKEAQTQLQKQRTKETQTQLQKQKSKETQTQAKTQPPAVETQAKNPAAVAETQANKPAADAETQAKKKTRHRDRKKTEAKHVNQQLPKKARALFSNNMQQFFVEHVQLATTLKHIPAYDGIENELMELLQKVFPNQTIKLFKFGSRISGVGTRDSDLDIYVDIDNNFINFENRPSSKTLSHISMTYSALMKTNQRWKHIIQIKNARVPILKVLNSATNIECDIGFSNSLGYCNTKLVEYLLNLQPIARCMCIFLKKWLDRSKLSSVSSYSMTLMVIFYLQVNKLLPSVQSLQIGLTKKLHVGPWLGNFVEKSLEQCGIEEVAMNTQAVKLLLQNFFEFYVKFPYDKCVICPYLATLNIGINEITNIMPKRYLDFVNGPVGKAYPLEVEKKSIIVQDPLQLNHNVTKNITKLNLALLKDYMEHSLRLFEEMC